MLSYCFVFCHILGSIDKYRISEDEQFIACVLDSGKFISLRVMDENAPDYDGRTEALLASHPPPCNEV